MPKKTPKEIVEESLPDMEVVEEEVVPDAVARADVKPGPSIEALRRKYLGDDAVAGAPQDAAVEGEADEDDIEVKKVRSKKRHADPADDPGPRTVIISKSKGLLGSQG